MAGILFDARWVRPGMTGVGNFAYNFLRASSIPRDKCGVIICRGSPFRGDFEGYRIFETRIDLIHHPMTDIYEQAVIPWLCLRHGYRSFVSFEGRTPILHPGFRTYPFVYDLSVLKLKGSHDLKYRMFLRVHLLISRLAATRIATISRTIQVEMVDTLGILPGKVIVAYPADSLLKAREASPVELPARPFLLAVGITNRRKNLPALLAAIMCLPANARPLVVATGNRDLIFQASRQAPEAELLNLGFVEDSQLRTLYEKAAALIYPSLDEGFGIPLVDACVFGLPVLCSDIPVFREVMENSAIYFDPKSPPSIAAAIRAFAEGPALDKARCAAVASRFSWEETARQFLADLEEG